MIHQNCRETFSDYDNKITGKYKHQKFAGDSQRESFDGKQLKIEMMELEKNDKLFSIIRETILKARTLVYKSSNAILLNMYWEIGRIIVENEQAGKSKAEYGKAILKNLSKQLTLEFGAGFDESNLRNIR